VLHYGIRSNSYDTLIDVGPNLQHTVSGLKEGSSYYFAVTAYNELEESTYSTEVSHTPLQNQPPTADAGSDISVEENATVYLNASDSFDPDDGIKRLYWEQLSGSVVELVNREEDICQFVAPDIGSESEALVFQVVVQDYSDQISSATCSVTVTPLPDTTSSPVVTGNTGTSETPVDTIKIQEAVYSSRKDRLFVEARIEGGGSASVLKVRAVCGGQEIQLGDLRYRNRKECYQGVFRNLDQAPERIIVVSSTGGEASSACIAIR
jgi:hypothetical protein